LAERLNWARDGKDWPHRELSHFVNAGGLRWHVQRFPSPCEGASALLLIHGTGASAHSWRELAPLLAKRFEVLMLDLPGQGFTAFPAAAQTMSLPGMARALGALLKALHVAPQIVVGHSAGAAIAARMCLDGLIAPKALVSLNGAFLPLTGPAWHLFSPIAKLLALNPFVPRLVAWRANTAVAMRRLIEGTGSEIDAEGVELYSRLVRSPGQVSGALAMMAAWDLDALKHDLPRLQPRLLLVTGSNDRTLPPAQAREVAALVPSASVMALEGLGHLAHEEQPWQVAKIVILWAKESGVFGAQKCGGREVAAE
jgi:magnesium chelatase accessory protein